MNFPRGLPKGSRRRSRSTSGRRCRKMRRTARRLSCRPLNHHHIHILIIRHVPFSSLPLIQQLLAPPLQIRPLLQRPDPRPGLRGRRRTARQGQPRAKQALRIPSLARRRRHADLSPLRSTLRVCVWPFPGVFLFDSSPRLKGGFLRYRRAAKRAGARDDGAQRPVIELKVRLLLLLPLRRCPRGRRHRTVCRCPARRPPRRRRRLGLALRPAPLHVAHPPVQHLTQVLLAHARALSNLHNGRPAVQLQLLALVEVARAGRPVRVADEVAALVVHHDAAVERVVLEAPVLPALLLAPQVVREEAYEVEHGGRRGQRRRRRRVAAVRAAPGGGRVGDGPPHGERHDFRKPIPSCCFVGAPGGICWRGFACVVAVGLIAGPRPRVKRRDGKADRLVRATPTHVPSNPATERELWRALSLPGTPPSSSHHFVPLPDCAQ